MFNATNEPFLSLAMPMPDGTTTALQLDEPAARKFLAEMETWGDDCSPCSKGLRQALRDRFAEAPLIRRC